MFVSSQAFALATQPQIVEAVDMWGDPTKVLQLSNIGNSTGDGSWAWIEFDEYAYVDEAGAFAFSDNKLKNEKMLLIT